MSEQAQERDPMLDFLDGKKVKPSEVTGAKGGEEPQPEPTETETESNEEKGLQEEQEQKPEGTEPSGDEQKSEGQKTDQQEKEVKEESKTISYKDALDKLNKGESIQEELEKGSEKTTESKESTKDPEWKKFFETEDEYKQFLLKKELGKKNIMSEEQINSMSPKDLVLKKMLDDLGQYGMTKEAALEQLAEKHGVSVEDLDDKPYLIAKDAKEAADFYKSQVQDVLNGINIGETNTEEQEVQSEKIDQQKQEAVRQENLRKWSEMGELIIQDPNATKITEKIGDETFEYVMEESFVKEIPATVKQIADARNLELNQENLEGLLNEIHNYYFINNRPKIMKAFQDESLKRIKEEQARELDNPKSNNEEKKVVTKENMDDKFLEFLDKR